MRVTLSIALLASTATANVASAPGDALRHMGAQGVNFWRLQTAAANSSPRQSSAKFSAQGIQTPLVRPAPSDLFQEYWFEQPVDHFAKSNASAGTFKQRYWINTRHYNASKGGPVFVLDGGETSGAHRLPFLDTGIMDILPKATGGIGIVLEHRYYGESLPVKDLSTDSLRWLNNDQSAADSANFMKNVKFDGIAQDLTAPSTPWIYYGGSYAGARAAHMRVLYPDIVYGAIASSGVTHAFVEYWEYMDTIRLAADPTCSAKLQQAVLAIDAILTSGKPYLIHALKGLFGVAELKHGEDFASLITHPLGAWQAKNWDDEVGSTGFEKFCKVLSRPPLGYPGGDDDDDDDDDDDGDNPAATAAVRHVNGVIEATVGPLSLPLTVVNYARYIKKHVVSHCPEESSVEECFGTFEDSKFQDISLDQEWRKWLFQVCTEWGYFFVAPPPDYPRIVSQMHTLYYETKICTQAFPPGKHFAVPGLPNVTAVNALGDFDIAADRLAIIDGEIDPWKPATPHSRYAQDRENTLLRPFIEIKGGVHHWDENGLRHPKDEPAEIRRVHKEMITFVKAWLKDWEITKREA